MRFRGYRRKDGSVGVRNRVAVISCTGCINEAPKLISQGIPGIIPLGHNLSCSHLGTDLERSLWILTNLAGNPNVYGVVLVGMGCEQMSPEKIYQGVLQFEKPVELFMLRDSGNWNELVEQGRTAVQRMAEEATHLRREDADIGELTLGIKCGGSDTTSGVVSNPVAGYVADHIIREGGRVIFTETPEILGAEHVLARRAVNKEVAARVLEAAKITEKRIEEMGVDLRGSEPTPANIQGGLTTIEEKSLGAIVKAGSAPLQGVLNYGERPQGKGLYFMDGPARTAELLVGIAAAGCQLMIFSMGGGLPSLLPMLPAALGALAALIMMLIICKNRISVMGESLRNTTRVTCMFLFIVICAAFFTLGLAVSGIPDQLTRYMTSLHIHPLALMALLLIPYIPLGMLLDTVSMLVITLPVIYPVVKALGFSGIWFGIRVTKLIEVSLMTPPVGLNVFVISGIVPDVPISRVFKGCVPFLIMDLVTLSLLFFFPEISTWLPDTMLSK